MAAANDVTQSFLSMLSRDVIGSAKRATNRAAGLAYAATQGRNMVAQKAARGALMGAVAPMQSRFITGAIYGAGINGALQIGSNVMAGVSPFSGVLSASMRGGLYGGIGYAGYGGMRALGGQDHPAFLKRHGLGRTMMGGLGRR